MPVMRMVAENVMEMRDRHGGDKLVEIMVVLVVVMPLLRDITLMAKTAPSTRQ